MIWVNKTYKLLQLKTIYLSPFIEGMKKKKNLALLNRLIRDWLQMGGIKAPPSLKSATHIL